MSDKSIPAGHQHDLDPVILGRGYADVRMVKHGLKKDAQTEAPSEGVASGSTDYGFGVHCDEITVDIRTKGNGWGDRESVHIDRISIDSAEYMIRGLMALVKEAKKNAIDKPGMFGSSSYSPLPMNVNEEEVESA